MSVGMRGIAPITTGELILNWTKQKTPKPYKLHQESIKSIDSEWYTFWIGTISVSICLYDLYKTRLWNGGDRPMQYTNCEQDNPRIQDSQTSHYE